jgi:predicted glycosyltransferase
VGREAFDSIVGNDPRPYVLCSVGGGRDGDVLCDTFARADLPKGHRGILITGSQMSAANRQRIETLAAGRADLTVVEFVREPIVLAHRAAAIVGMGGYNTTSEMLSLGRPALIVPRVRPRQEQVLRAARLADRGLVDMIHPDTLTPEGLGVWLADAVKRPPAPRDALDMDGLQRVRVLADAALADRTRAFRKSA